MALRRNPALQQGCAVFAKNKKRVSAFYQQALGLAVVESKPSHDLLRGNSDAWLRALPLAPAGIQR